MLDITPLNENPMHSPKLPPIDPIILNQVVNQIFFIDCYYFWRRENIFEFHGMPPLTPSALTSPPCPVSAC